MFLQTLKLPTFSVASNFLMAMSRVQNVPVMEKFELYSNCYNNENNENYNRNDHDVNDDNLVEDDN